MMPRPWNRFGPLGSLSLGLLAVGCSSERALPELDIDVEVTLSEAIPTVAMANWTRQEKDAVETWMEFGLTTDYELEAPVDMNLGRELETQLLGMKPNSEYHFRLAMLQEDGRVQYSTDQTFSTGSAPSVLPDFDVSWYDNAPTEPGFIITSTLVAPAAVMIIDMDGDIVWWHLAEEDVIGQSKLSLDGEGVYYQRINVEGQNSHRLRYISLDGETQLTWDVPSGHHDFSQLPDGKIGLLAHDQRFVEGEEVIGDKIVELSPDGTIEEVYSTWDDLTYGGSTGLTQGTGWTHANVLQYDAEDDAYLVSYKSLDSIHKIDRSTGERVWSLGGAESDFAMADGSSRIFESQHQFQVLEDSILVFVNGDEVDDLDSMAMEYSFDESNPVVEEIWTYENDPGLFCFSLGDVQRLENGNTHVNWSVQGQMDEVDADGNLLWRLIGPLGSAFGYSERLDNLYVD
jgi:hypothetical protein